MQFRGLLVGAVLLAILSGGVWWSQKNEKEKEAKGTSDVPKLVTLKEGDVRKLEIRHLGEPPTVLQRGSSDKWELVAPQPLRVDSDAASGIVSGFANLTWDQLVDEKPRDLASFGLQTPALEVVATGKDGKTQRILIGDDAPTGGSSYAKLDGDPRVFAISTATKGTFDKTSKDLRDKRLLTFDSEKLARVDLNAKGSSVEFGKNSGNEWQIVKPKPLRADGFQVEELVRKLKDAKMDTSVSEVDAKKAASSFAAGALSAIASVTDNSGTQTLQIRKTGTDYYAKSSAVDGIYKVTAELGDGVQKSLDDFRNKKLFDFGFTEPGKIEIRDAGKTYAFSKSGDKWSAGGKQMDSVSVQAMVDKLRDLSASKFVDTGFGTPEVDISVTSNEGKRVENVVISKTAKGGYIAKRGSEPALYEIDTKNVEDLRRSVADVKEPPPPAKK